MSLDRVAVEDNLRKVASTARCSLVAFDYYTTTPLDLLAFFWRIAPAGTRANGEPLRFGIVSTPSSRKCLAEFLRSCGFSLCEQRRLRNETEGQRAWSSFVTAIVNYVRR